MSVNDAPLISIVVPVYKVEGLLERCVVSILNQSYNNIEVILVDDGSPDRCGELCDQYAGKDRRVKVLHQENQGLSAARNAGVRMANGEYIGFVDSDDYINPDMYQILWDAIDASKASIAVCGIIDHFEDLGEKKADFDGETQVLEPSCAIQGVLINDENITAHAVKKLYRKDILEKHPFPIGKLYEDVYTVVRFFMEADKIAVVHKGLYYYCHRSNSIVESPFSKRDMDLKDAWEQNQKLVMKKFPELKEAMEYRYFSGCFYLLDKMINSNARHPEEEKELVTVLRSNYKRVVANAYFLKTRKIGMLVLKFSLLGYKVLCHMQTKRMDVKMKRSIKNDGTQT